jgi:hypothetical protein
MKAIQTKVLFATNFKPTRIKASAEGVKSIVWPRDSLEQEKNTQPDLDHLNLHAYAALKFALARNWSGNLASGGLPDGTWAHCFVTAQKAALDQAKPFLRGQELVVAQARTFVAESWPTQPGKHDGTRYCSACHFELLRSALVALDEKA